MDSNEKISEISEKLVAAGFEDIGDGSFKHEKVSYSTVNINGTVSRKERRDTLVIRYSGTGGEVDDSDVCDDSLLFYDVSFNGKDVGTFGVSCFEDLVEEVFGK